MAAQIDRSAKGLSVVPDPTTIPATGSILNRRANKLDKNRDQNKHEGVRRASVKLQDGDVRWAARCLYSEETLAPSSRATQLVILQKHPPQPPDRRTNPTISSACMTVSAAEVKSAICSFTPRICRGRDGLRPQHPKDLSDDRVGGNVCESIADFCNLILAGNIPDAVRPLFFGASLFPFTKKDGGIRPIAVGLTLRRLIAKMANSRALETCGAILAPTQLGVGVKGGAEALTHSARLYLQHMDKDRAFVKLDFTNAFNSIRRDAVLESVARHRPDLLAFVTAAYGSTSQLWMGDICIDSAEGVQQGDPLGPLLFCLALDDALKGLQCEFVSGYLDDIGLGDNFPRLINHIQGLEAATQALGLSLNYSKCEVIGLSASSAHLEGNVIWSRWRVM